jgi:hypothetical protein
MLQKTVQSSLEVGVLVTEFIRSQQYVRRKWNWIGHTLRKEAGATEKTALDWNPQGQRRRGSPKRRW